MHGRDNWLYEGEGILGGQLCEARKPHRHKTCIVSGWILDILCETLADRHVQNFSHI